MTLFRIGTAARLAGVEVETLRTWERRYGFAPSARTAGKQRLYSLDDVARLRSIKEAVESGLSAGEAHNVLREQHQASPTVRLSDIVGRQEVHKILMNAPDGRCAAERDNEPIPRRIRELINATWDVVYRMNPDWTEMRALAGRGFLPDTAKPDRAWLNQYIEPADQAAVLEAISDAVADKRMFELEHRVRRSDGTVGWTLSRAVPLVDRGNITEWVGAAMDVTAQHEAQEALARSEQRLRLVLETDAVGVVFFDYGGRVIDANDVFLRTTGYTREDIENRTLTRRALTPPEWRDAAERQMQMVTLCGCLGPYEMEWICRDGSRRRMLFSGRDLADGTVCEYCIDVQGYTPAPRVIDLFESRYAIPGP